MECEGIFYSIKVIFSNRWGDALEITSGGSDSVETFRGEQVQVAIEDLKKGADPDKIARFLLSSE